MNLRNFDNWRSLASQERSSRWQKSIASQTLWRNTSTGTVLAMRAPEFTRNKDDAASQSSRVFPVCANRLDKWHCDNETVHKNHKCRQRQLRFLKEGCSPEGGSRTTLPAPEEIYIYCLLVLLNQSSARTIRAPPTIGEQADSRQESNYIWFTEETSEIKQGRSTYIDI